MATIKHKQKRKTLIQLGQSHFAWAVVPLVVVTAVGAGSLMTRHSYAATPVVSAFPVGAWNLDENPILPNSQVADTYGLSPGQTPTNWSGSSVASLSGSGTGAYYFPGWQNRIGAKSVDATASSFSIANDNRFNPETKDFSVSLWVKALDPSSLVQSGVIKKSDTLNIIQKGLSGTGLQQWKVSVNATGKFICTFRGPDAAGTIYNYEVPTKIYPFNVARKVTCSLSAGTIYASVQTGTVIDNYSGAGPIGGIRNTSPINVGKKTDSNHIEDTFAGVLDDIVISKGP